VHAESAIAYQTISKLSVPSQDNHLFGREEMAGSGEVMAAAVQNKKVVLRRHATGFPTEDDMEITVDTVGLRVPAD
jgi:hypothetical protein